MNFCMKKQGEEVQTVGASERNLNTWKVNIPTVGSRLDPITNKACTVFVIQIQTEGEFIGHFQQSLQQCNAGGNFGAGATPPKFLVLDVSRYHFFFDQNGAKLSNT